MNATTITQGRYIKGLIIELTCPKSVSVSERKTSSFTHTDTYTNTVLGEGDVFIIMRPLRCLPPPASPGVFLM